jgi:LuxR family maltose regulon positive regulatory protein
MYRRAAIDTMAGLALTHQALDRSAATDATADDLLAFAGETGDLNAGPPMAVLLQRLTERTGRGSHADRLVAALSDAGSRASEAVASSANHSDKALIAESLTAREFDILECLTKRLCNKEIARQLSLSEETVKFHLKNLYQKLAVANRREAAVKAAEILAAKPPETPSAERTDGS